LRDAKTTPRGRVGKSLFPNISIGDGIFSDENPVHSLLNQLSSYNSNARPSKKF